ARRELERPRAVSRTSCLREDRPFLRAVGRGVVRPRLQPPAIELFRADGAPSASGTQASICGLTHGASLGDQDRLGGAVDSAGIRRWQWVGELSRWLVR